MIDYSKEHHTAITAPKRVIHATVVLNGREYTDIELKTLEYDSSIGSGNNFQIGGGNINSLTVEIKEVVDNLEPLMESTATLTVEGGEHFSLGHFFVDEVTINRNTKVTKVKMQDAFLLLSREYKSALTYPTSVQKVLEEIIDLTRIRTVPTLQIANDTIQVPLEKGTYRDAIIYIAQLNAGFARFNRDGLLDFIRLKNTGYHITKDMYPVSGLSREEFKYQLGGIRCEVDSKNKVVYQVGNDKGSTMELKNPWMTQAILERVYHELRQLNFYPYTLNWRGDMALEAGDWVSVWWDEQLKFNIPFLSYKLKYDGGLSATATAKGESATRGEYQYKGPLQRKVDILETLITEQGQMYMDEMEPPNPKQGDVWFKPNGGYVELYEYLDKKWVKKADTADLDSIVTRITTDEVLAKKFVGAIAKFIEIDANKAIIGDLDLSRMRIVNNGQEILAVRDGKLVVNLGDSDKYSELSNTVNALENSIYQKTTMMENLIKETTVRLNAGETKEIPITLLPDKSYDFKFSYIGDCEVYVVFEFQTDKRKYPYRYRKKRMDYMRFGKKVSSIIDRHQLFSFKSPKNYVRSYILYRTKNGARIYDLEFSQNSESLTVDKISKLRQDLDSFSVDMQNNLDETKSSLTLTTKEFATKIEDYKKDSDSLIQQKSDEISLSVRGKVDKAAVIAAINLSPEGVRIQGNKVNVTGDMLVEGSLGAYRGKIGDFYIGKYQNYTGQWITNTGYQVGMGSLGGTALWANWGYNWGSPQQSAWYMRSNGQMHVGNGMDVYGTADFSSGSVATFYGDVTFSKAPNFNGGANFSGGISIGGRLNATGGIWTGNSNIYGYSARTSSGQTQVVWWSEQDDFLGTSSDRNLKKNITKATISGMELIQKLNLVQFDWKQTGEHEAVGLIAQELQELLPQAVTEMKEGHLGIQYMQLIPYLLKAVQELSAENIELKQRMDLLERRN